MHRSWALYVVLGVQPVLISVILIASFVLSYFSAVDGYNFSIIAILAGVRTETLKLFEGASFSGTLKKPVGIRIDNLTTKKMGYRAIVCLWDGLLGVVGTIH